jgi:hypothetical protein
MIVCEIGNIPPHSVPVVIREIMDYEDEQSEGELFSDDDSSDENELDLGSTEMKERDEEDEDEDDMIASAKEALK